MTPADEGSPTPAIQGAWTAVATKVDAAAGGLHVDVTITQRHRSVERDAGDGRHSRPSSRRATASRPTAPTVFVGTGGTYLAPGFQVRGYTGGTKTKPETQLLYVECAGAALAAGSKLSVAYGYVTGEFNYYTPPTPTSAKLEIDLDTVAADLTYPVAAPVAGVIEPADTKIVAINNCTLTLTGATADRRLASISGGRRTTPPSTRSTSTSATRPSSGRTASSTGSTRVPTSRTRRSRRPGGSAHWTTTVAVPADVTGLYILVDGREQAAEELRQPCHRHHRQVARTTGVRQGERESDAMKPLGEFEVWFVTGSQDMYGEATLRQVAENARRVATALDGLAAIPVRVVHRPGRDLARRASRRRSARRTPPTRASASSSGCTRSRRRGCGSAASRPSASRSSTSTPSSTAISPGARSTWTS